MTNRDILLGTIFLLREDIENNTNLDSICDGLAEALPLLEGDWCWKGCGGVLEMDEEQEVVLCNRCYDVPDMVVDGSLGDTDKVVDAILEYIDNVWKVSANDITQRCLHTDKENMEHSKEKMLNIIQEL